MLNAVGLDYVLSTTSNKAKQRVDGGYSTSKAIPTKYNLKFLDYNNKIGGMNFRDILIYRYVIIIIIVSRSIVAALSVRSSPVPFICVRCIPVSETLQNIFLFTQSSHISICMALLLLSKLLTCKITAERFLTLMVCPCHFSFLSWQCLWDLLHDATHYVTCDSFCLGDDVVGFVGDIYK